MKKQTRLHNFRNSLRTIRIQSFRGNFGKHGGPHNQSHCQNQGNQGNKPCYFCGNPFTPDHRKSCPARNVTCNLCRKRGNFAKCFNLSKRRVNLVHEEEETPSPALDCGFIDVENDSEPEYGVFHLEDTVQINSIELLTSAAGKPRSLSIQLRSASSFLFHYRYRRSGFIPQQTHIRSINLTKPVNPFPGHRTTPDRNRVCGLVQASYTVIWIFYDSCFVKRVKN